MATVTVSQLVERTSSQYTAQLLDELGGAVPASSLSTLVLTLYDRVTNAIINSRNQQNVLNTNGVTIDASGNITWSITPADNVILNDALAVEMHVALFEATWAGGTKGCKHKVVIPVQNMARVS